MFRRVNYLIGRESLECVRYARNLGADTYQKWIQERRFSSSSGSRSTPSPLSSDPGSDAFDTLDKRLSSNDPQLLHKFQNIRTAKHRSPIFCQGELLRIVQLAAIYPDSKTFVDKKMRDSPEETMQRFRELLQRTEGDPPRDDVLAFVDQSFEDGEELEAWTPPDWTAEPPLLQRLACPEYRAWAAHLNSLWRVLGRKIKVDVHDNPQQYSLLYVPNGFVIPGGRFTELYYWDTYWIVQGLLLCSMPETVKGIIENLLYLVRRVGFVPNGSRVYYEHRSQPPLLIPMVVSYLQHTGDLAFVRENLPLIEREFLYWMNNAVIEVNKNGRTYRLARYFMPSDGPRPESYREDILTASHLATEEERQHLYWDIKSAAATGWDFSSRWVIHEGTNGGSLGHLRTRYIVPVDLNAFLYGNARGLAAMLNALGEPARAAEYQRIADEWRESVNAVLWDAETGSWLDYDLLNNAPRRYFYASNLTPLWTQCYEESAAFDVAKASLHYLSSSGVLKYLGGTPSSMTVTGEQWDFPNCWSPLQGMLVQGLNATGHPGAQRVALELARRWLLANYRGFQEHKQMFEKYEVEVIGRCGGGGEYAAQAGFGWTNGVCFELLADYGHLVSGKDEPHLIDVNMLHAQDTREAQSVATHAEEAQAPENPVNLHLSIEMISMAAPAFAASDPDASAEENAAQDMTLISTLLSAPSDTPGGGGRINIA